jgi:hypothetical protein
MSRSAVRAEFEARFTAARMARDYVAAYRLLLAGASARTDAAAAGTKLEPANRKHIPLEDAGSLARRASG